MRHYVNDVPDNDIIETMHDEWEENIFAGGLDSSSKEDIRDKLNFFIESDKRKTNRSYFVKIAAVLIPLITISSILIHFMFNNENHGNMIVSVERGNKAMVTLPDETVVWINANSTLEYSQSDKNKRHAILKGEAFFKVKEDKKRPFIVGVDGMEIEVLGTSFNVKARENSHVIETSLVEGRVKIGSKELMQDYYLEPNEKAIFNKKLHSMKITQTDNDLETAWMYNKLKFSSERLADVLIRLEDWYGVKINNHCPDIADDLISGTFREERIENALEALKIQYKNINLQFKRQKDTITIYRN